jgi:hypothetical protein
MQDLTREWTQQLGGFSHFIVVSPDRKRVLAAHQLKPFCFGVDGPSESWGFQGHTGRITCAKFMGNEHVVTASADKTVRCELRRISHTYDHEHQEHERHNHMNIKGHDDGNAHSVKETFLRNGMSTNNCARDKGHWLAACFR